MTQTIDGSNIETHLSALRKQLGKLGENEANGNASRPEAGKALVNAAYDGYIGEDYAAEGYEVYVAGIAKVAARKPGAQNRASEKAQISKFRQLIKAGALPDPIDFRDVIQRMEALYTAHVQADTKVHPLFDAMVALARAQVKSPDEELSDDEINGVILKPEPKEKDETDKLVASYKSLHKISNDFPRPETEAALEQLRSAIVAAGGEVPPMTKEEKQEAAAMEFLRSRGMVGVRAIAAE